jgi:glucose-6-phosphate isomerase
MQKVTIDLRSVSGLELEIDQRDLTLVFGPDVVGPSPEKRSLSQVRSMLEDPDAAGPEHLYTIYMGVSRRDDVQPLAQQGLVYGALVYNYGSLGKERLRNQGHIHSKRSGTELRYSEIFEFWTGHGYVYLQKEAAPDVTRAVLVEVAANDKLVVPFGWVHLVVTLGEEVLSFGAWTAADNRLEYDEVRQLRGPAYYFHADGTVVKNSRYHTVPNIEYAKPADFPSLDIPSDRPIYTSWREHPELYTFVASPEVIGDVWRDF